LRRWVPAAWARCTGAETLGWAATSPLKYFPNALQRRSPADASLKRALDLEPGNAPVIENKAQLDKALGRFDEAVELLQRAVAIEPLSADNYYNLSITLNHAGRQEEGCRPPRRRSRSVPIMPPRTSLWR
jgi:tetratricopeptide (TPR) repeat protein